jgi:putative membrane protein
VTTYLELTTTDLAVERSRMAAERTLMAWIRTSLSMISFGFTIFKFFQYMLESKTTSSSWQPTGALHMGSTLVIVGTLLLIPAGFQHWMFLRLLKKQAKTRFPISLAQVTAGFIALLGLGAITNLFFRWGPF